VAVLAAVACCRAGSPDQRDASSVGGPEQARPTDGSPTADGADAGGASPTADGGPTRAAPPPTAPASWREAARIHDWDRALSLLGALPPEEQAKPEHRLALGRIALAAGQHEQAVGALKGLEQQLPLLRDEVRRWVAEAAAQAGPYEEAAEILASSARVRDRVLAAQAYERAGKPKTARKLIDRAVRSAGQARRKAVEARARAARARLVEKTGKGTVALLDWLWIAKHQPALPEARQALAAIPRLNGRLSLADELNVLTRSTNSENLDETLLQLDARARAHKGQPGLIAMARAKALYFGRRYPEAVAAFDAAVTVVAPVYRPEALYYAGRSSARAGDVAAALDRYQRTRRGYAKSGWAERAAFRHADLLLQVGRFAEAAKSFRDYLGHYGKSHAARKARRGRALALLSSGHPKSAKALLVALQKDAPSRRDRAMLRQLEGLAALRADDRKGAVRIWLELASEQPLTWPAMAARARLLEIGHEPPPRMPGGDPAAARALAVALPEGPALLHSLGLDADAEQKLRREEQKAAKLYPDRESEALCAMYGLLSCAGRRQRIGARAVDYQTLMQAPRPDSRWAWDCVYPAPYPELVRREQERHGVPAGLVHAVMRQESAFRPDAVSPVGAKGLMQLMPKTARLAAAEQSLDIDLAALDRPELNVRLGTYYLGKLLRMSQGSLPVAVASYNAGPHAVMRWLRGETDRQADLWVARIPYRETRRYVARVLTNLARYQYLSGGLAAVPPLELGLPAELRAEGEVY